MAQIPLVKIRGLYLQPNPHSEVPQGALDIASNINIDRESIAESRRGFKQFNDPLVAPQQFFEFQQTLIAHDSGAFYYDAPGWTALAGTFNAPSSLVKVQGAALNKALFITTDAGLQRFDSPSVAPRAAGFYPALDVVATLSAAGSGFLAAGRYVAYRIVWGYRTAEQQLILGAPSARTVVQNTAGVGDTTALTFTIPAGITVTDFYQLYRSEQGTTADVSDELQLVVERSPSAGQITAGVVTVTDATPDAQRGAFIYTAPTQEGILQSNDQPPLMQDVVEFRQNLFAGATTQRHELLLSVETNAVLNDTVTVDGTVYTAKAAESIPANQFKFGVTITDTMRSLIRVVNRSASNSTVYLYELDGKTFVARTRFLTGASFSITSSVATLFNLPVPATSTQESVDYRVHISKSGRGDAWPRLSFIDPGAKPLRRLIALRDAVFALKDDGVYRITGTSAANFISEVHDGTVRIKGANTAVALNNHVFMMSNRGVVAVSVNGLDSEIGDPIQNELLRLAQLPNWDAVAWAAAYESDQKYTLWVPTTDIDTVATKCFVLNYETRQWTSWSLSATAAIERPSNLLFYVGRSDGQVVEERKSFTLDDFADDEFAVTITASTADTVTLSAVPAGVVVGTTLRQDDSTAKITDVTGLVLTLNRDTELWDNAAATVYTPIEVSLRFVKYAAGIVASYKHFPEVGFVFEDAGFEDITATFATDLSGGTHSVPLQSFVQGTWGEFEWPDDVEPAEWGGQLGGAQTIPTYVPRDCSLAEWIEIGLFLEEAFTALSLAGVQVTAYGAKGRVR